MGKSPHSYLPISVCALTSLTTLEISAAIKCLFFIQNFFFLFFDIQRIIMKKSIKITLFTTSKEKKKEKKKERVRWKKEGEEKKAMVACVRS